MHSAITAWEITRGASLGKLPALPPHQADQVDLMLVATALAGAATIVTNDRWFRAYGVPTLRSPSSGGGRKPGRPPVAMAARRGPGGNPFRQAALGGPPRPPSIPFAPFSARGPGRSRHPGRRRGGPAAARSATSPARKGASQITRAL